MKDRPIIFSAPMVRALLAGTKTQTRRIVKHQGILDHPAGKGFKVILLGNKEAWLNSRPDHPQHITKFCPYGQPGDRLWVRETWTETINIEGIPDWPDRPCTLVDDDPSDVVIYRADGEWEWLDDEGGSTDKTNWKSPLFMPRWASRILLELTAVRVERLQDISEEDAIAEGCEADKPKTWWQGYMWDEHIEDYIHQQHMGEGPPEWMFEPKRMAPKPWLVRSAKDHYRALWESINGAGSWHSNPFVWVIEFKRIEP